MKKSEKVANCWLMEHVGMNAVNCLRNVANIITVKHAGTDKITYSLFLLYPLHCYTGKKIAGHDAHLVCHYFCM